MSSPTEQFDFDVLVVGSGLRRLGHRAAADREGLPGRRARGRRALRGRRLRLGHLRPHALPVGAGARLLRHPAHRRASATRMIVAGAGVGGGSLVYANTLYEPLAGVLHRPAVAPHHRLEGRARAVLRPGQADARRRRQPGADAGRRRDGEGRRPTWAWPTPSTRRRSACSSAAPAQPAARRWPTRSSAARARRATPASTAASACPAAGTTPRTRWSRTTSTSPRRTARRCCR